MSIQKRGRLGKNKNSKLEQSNDKEGFTLIIRSKDLFSFVDNLLNATIAASQEKQRGNKMAKVAKKNAKQKPRKQVKKKV